MPKKFDAQYLYRLRNEIPIADFIANTLGLPCKHSEGYFRFLCPICHEFRTATHKKTNLARCFLCERNLNCIDLVMLVHRVKFVDAVNFLSQILRIYENKRKI